METKPSHCKVKDSKCDVLQENGINLYVFSLFFLQTLRI